MKNDSSFLLLGTPVSVCVCVCVCVEIESIERLKSADRLFPRVYDDHSSVHFDFPILG